jgi:hypothetical protein
MQVEEAKTLRERWREQGDQHCSHLKIVKEYYRGTHTMDYVCTDCGKEFSLTEKKDIEQNHGI